MSFYLYVIKSVAEEEADEWSGKMNETKKAIVTVGAQVKKEICENNKEIKEIKKEILENNKEVKKEVSEVKKEIKKEISVVNANINTKIGEVK